MHSATQICVKPGSEFYPYVYRPIEVNGEVFDKTDIMCF